MDPEDRTDDADRGAAASLDRRRFLQGASGAAVALVAAGRPATALARSLCAGAHTGEGGRRGKPLTLQVYKRNDPSQRRPGVVFIHGGGWAGGRWAGGFGESGRRS